MQNAGEEKMILTDLVEFLITLPLWLNVRQLVSTAEPASPLTGNQATMGKPVGF